MAFLSEAELEQSLLEQLRGLGYSIQREEDIGPDGHRPERESHDEVLLRRRFKDAVDCLISGAPRIADAEACLQERDL
jgi:type I restriction enzyme R subunit